MKLTIDIDEDDIKIFDSILLESVCNNLDDLVESFAENSLIGFLDRLVDIKLNLEELAIPLRRLNSVIASAYFEAKQTFTNGSFDQAVGRTKRKRDWKVGDKFTINFTSMYENYSREKTYVVKYYDGNLILFIDDKNSVYGVHVNHIKPCEEQNDTNDAA